MNEKNSKIITGSASRCGTCGEIYTSFPETEGPSANAQALGCYAQGIKGPDLKLGLILDGAHGNYIVTTGINATVGHERSYGIIRVPKAVESLKTSQDKTYWDARKSNMQLNVMQKLFEMGLIAQCGDNEFKDITSVLTDPLFNEFLPDVLKGKDKSDFFKSQPHFLITGD